MLLLPVTGHILKWNENKISDILLVNFRGNSRTFAVLDKRLLYSFSRFFFFRVLRFRERKNVKSCRATFNLFFPQLLQFEKWTISFFFQFFFCSLRFPFFVFGLLIFISRQSRGRRGKRGGRDRRRSKSGGGFDNNLLNVQINRNVLRMFLYIVLHFSTYNSFLEIHQ